MSEAGGRVYSRVGRVPALDSASAPLARCGHSLTACLGENSRKLILFGGATALENSSSGGGAATGIRLAGATSDVHCFDIRSGAWTKLAPEGEAPSPRAAHAAAAVGSMVVVQARPPRAPAATPCVRA
jgi:protein phosphatase